MNASVIKIADIRRGEGSLSRQHAARALQQSLPLDSREFAGRIFFWPSSRLGDSQFDRILRLSGVQSIIDLRDDAILGERKALHQERCDCIGRWRILFLRIGPIMANAERISLLPFDKKNKFLSLLSDDPTLLGNLQTCSQKGAVLIIHPDNDDRLDVFLAACGTLGLSSFALLPLRRPSQ